MSKFQIILDTAMCALWITTYTLVLIGSIRYRYPLISPITQAIIAPFEFSALCLFIKLNSFRLDYASIAYLYWTVIEIVIIGVFIRDGYIKKKHIVPYSSMVLLITAVMIWRVTVKGHMFLYSYINTFIGVIIWLLYIARNKNYPMKSISLILFITKLTADLFAIPVYFGNGTWLENSVCILLPTVDVCFIALYFLRKRNKKVF